MPFWNRGFITEAAFAVLNYGFEALDLERVQASHLGCNPASGRVMQKIGMRPEGTSRRAAQKWGEFHDLMRYAILRDEWSAAKAVFSDSEHLAPGNSEPF